MKVGILVDSGILFVCIWLAFTTLVGAARFSFRALVLPGVGFLLISAAATARLFYRASDQQVFWPSIVQMCGITCILIFQFCYQRELSRRRIGLQELLFLIRRQDK